MQESSKDLGKTLCRKVTRIMPRKYASTVTRN